MEEKVVTKTIEEWFNELEEPYRTQAIENTIKLSNSEYTLKSFESSLSEALSASFVWEASPEGHEYWRDLFGKYLEE